MDDDSVVQGEDFPVTEQRESDVPDGEPTRPEDLDALKPDTGSWYPVAYPPAEQDAEPGAPAADERTVAEPSVDEPAPAPVEEPPAAPPVEQWGTPAAEAVQPVPEEPIAPAEPAPAVPAEDAASADESAAPAPVDDPAPAAAEGPTAFSWVPEEPTVAVPAERPEEATVAVPIERPEEATAPVPGVRAWEPAPAQADAEPTAVVAAPAEESRTERLVIEGEPVPPAVVPADAIFRPASPASGQSPEPTRLEPVSEEEQRLAAERAARREARTVALAAPAPAPLMAPAPVVIHKRTNDKFFGSLGLFVLRIVVAGIMAIRGLNILTDIPTAQRQFAQTVIPEPGIMAIVTGVASELIALALLLGLLTRFAGLGIALIAGGALAFVYWGNWSPFVTGQPGFTGEFQLLLATVGLLLLLIGGGGWSLDRAFRAGRERDKRERAAAGQ
jgi:uncharacterized membrane protein YphA (DoxX/SURF4 family)